MSANNQILIKEHGGKYLVFDVMAEGWGEWDGDKHISDTNHLHINEAAGAFPTLELAYLFAEAYYDSRGAEYGVGLEFLMKDGTELYQVDNFMDTGETEYCMKMEHPSIKGKYYIEWVEPKIGKKKDADLAQATAFGITKEQYLEARIA